MNRVPPLEYPSAGPEMRHAYDQQVAAHGRVTNMKRTLGHSPTAFRALMEWYALRDEVVPFLGERRTNLFAHVISAETECLICSTFFRRILIDAGENPDALSLDDFDRDILDFGRRIARDSNQVDDPLFERLARVLGHRELVTLTAFGALMVATNVFNNALRVPLDDYLLPYRKENA